MKEHIINGEKYIDISDGRDKYKENEKIKRYATKQNHKDFCKAAGINFKIANANDNYKTCKKYQKNMQIFVKQQDFTNFISINPISPPEKQKDKKPKKKLDLPTLEEIKKCYGQSSIVSGLYVIIINFEDGIVTCKFGRSKNFQSRLNDHIKSYPGAYFFYFAHIDACFNSRAEVELSNYFKKIGEAVEGCEIEIFKIKATLLMNVRQKMDELAYSFSKNSDNLREVISQKDTLLFSKEALLKETFLKKELALSYLENISDLIVDKISILKN